MCLRIAVVCWSILAPYVSGMQGLAVGPKRLEKVERVEVASGRGLETRIVSS